MAEPSAMKRSTTTITQDTLEAGEISKSKFELNKADSTRLDVDKVDSNKATTVAESNSGSQASSTTATKAQPKWAGFLDLPAELRNRIYNLALVANLPVNIVRRVDHEKVWPSDENYRPNDQVGRATSYQFAWFREGKKEIWFGIEFGALPNGAFCETEFAFGYPLEGASAKDVSVSLLRTCRQINREATPILYGANTFHFDTYKSSTTNVWGRIQRFQKLIGSSVQHIRHVQFRSLPRGNSLRDMQKLQLGLQSLLGFSGLERLDLMTKDMVQAFSLQEVAAELVPFVQCFGKNPKSSHPQKTKLVDVISFTCKLQWENLEHPSYHVSQGNIRKRHGHEYKKAEYKKEAEDYEKAVKAEMLRLLAE